MDPFRAVRACLLASSCIISCPVQELRPLSFPLSLSHLCGLETAGEAAGKNKASHGKTSFSARCSPRPELSLAVSPLSLLFPSLSSPPSRAAAHPSNKHQRPPRLSVVTLVHVTPPTDCLSPPLAGTVSDLRLQKGCQAFTRGADLLSCGL